MIYRKQTLFSILKPLALFFVLLAGHAANAQQTADKIITVIGRSRIILQSELDAEITNFKQQDPSIEFTDTMRCTLLQQMILRKVLVEQAERDSVMVSDEEIESTLENRVRYFISMYGSKEKLEQISGKTIYQLKEENREVIKEGMLTERMQGNILQNVKITPAEVQAFYNKIPVDSLPFFPATVEMGQIVIDPTVTPEMDQYARTQLNDIRNQVVKDGKDFEAMAGLYSQDPGSRDNGGDLGTMGRNDFVPEFSAAAFKLQNGEVSPVIKTKFGYHIIQMVRRQGDQAHLRHILIRPERTTGDVRRALDKLDSVRSQLVAGVITFQQAVGKYSTDEMAQRTGGMITDPQSGGTEMEVDKLDPALALMVDTLKPGSYSPPQVFDKGGGERSTRIVYMKGISNPHKANLKEDYNRIQEAALQQKKSQHMDQWLADKSKSFYVKIAPEYATCEVLKVWAKQREEDKKNNK